MNFAIIGQYVSKIAPYLFFFMMGLLIGRWLERKK
jgi:hypothetical protein